MVQLDIGVTSGMQLEQVLGLIQIAQKSGLEHVWLGDDIAQPHDVFTVASVMLLRLPRINLGIGITGPLMRARSSLWLPTKFFKKNDPRIVSSIRSD